MVSLELAGCSEWLGGTNQCKHPLWPSNYSSDFSSELYVTFGIKAFGVQLDLGINHVLWESS